LQRGYGHQRGTGQLRGDRDNHEGHGDVYDQGELGGEHGLCVRNSHRDDHGQLIQPGGATRYYLARSRKAVPRRVAASTLSSSRPSVGTL